MHTVENDSYDPATIEASAQARWQQRAAFATPTPSQSRPHRYIKPSAPFTSGNIHIGHVRSYTIGDAYARFYRARGEDVLFAFGFDAFGLPAELGAIASEQYPSDWVERCARHMTAQLQRLGFSFDWERSFMSSDPTMYRWSQWLFLKLLEAGLVYRGTGAVDWCDHCQTTLASIQVEDGLCWRCHNPVRLIQRPQWLLRISAYLQENDERLTALADSGKWDESALASQRYVLGRVDGAQLDLTDAADGAAITVFTPHLGAAAEAKFVLVSPRDHRVERWASDPAVRAELEDLRSGGWERSARDAETVPVVETGKALLTPSGSRLPLVISPIVDSRFGVTLALGIPSRDRADMAIAQRLSQLAGAGDPQASAPESDAPAAKRAGGQAAAAASEEATASVRYRAYDFSISRQRAWGTPIPIVYCERCGAVPVAYEDLPVKLPRDLLPTGEGNPLAERADFVEATCPRCGGKGQRETDTLDCHFDALWLWIPVGVPREHRDASLEEILDDAELRKWLPCERVVAGSDSGNFVFDQRITTKALRDIGPLAYLQDGEPFAGCLFHEMVIRDNRKMSKHLGNVVDPDELVAQHGADTVRLAVLYAASPQHSLNWTETAVAHCHRFLSHLWEYAEAQFSTNASRDALPSATADVGKQQTDHLRSRLVKWCDAAITRITAALTDLDMHTAVRDAMRLLQRIEDFESRVLQRRGTLSEQDSDLLVAALVTLARLLAPFAPHITEEILSRSPHGLTARQQQWPEVGELRRLAAGALPAPRGPRAHPAAATPAAGIATDDATGT